MRFLTTQFLKDYFDFAHKPSVFGCFHQLRLEVYSSLGLPPNPIQLHIAPFPYYGGAFSVSLHVQRDYNPSTYITVTVDSTAGVPGTCSLADSGSGASAVFAKFDSIANSYTRCYADSHPSWEAHMGPANINPADTTSRLRGRSRSCLGSFRG